MVAEDQWAISLLYTDTSPIPVQSCIAVKSLSNENGSVKVGDIGEIWFPLFEDDGSRVCMAWKYPSVLAEFRFATGESGNLANKDHRI